MVSCASRGRTRDPGTVAACSSGGTSSCQFSFVGLPEVFRGFIQLTRPTQCPVLMVAHSMPWPWERSHDTHGRTCRGLRGTVGGVEAGPAVFVEDRRPDQKESA